jgi:hypothetical protein
MPGGHLYTNLGRVYALAESTYGTDAINAAITANSDITYYDVMSIDIVPSVANIENARVRGSGDSEAHSRINNNQTVTITGALTGATNVGNAGGETPHWADLIEAAGMAETVVSATSAAYNVATTAQTAVTVYHWRRAAESYKYRGQYATGVRGNMSFSFSLNTPATYTFEGQSNNMPESSDTANYQQGVSEELAFFDANGLIDLRLTTGASVVYTGSEAYADDPKFLPTSITATLNSVSLQASSINYNLNREVVAIQEITGTPNVAKVLSNPGTPTIEVVLTESAAGYEQVLALAKSGAEVAWSHTQSLGSGNDQITFSAPKVQVDATGPVRQANGSVIGHSFRLLCRGNYASSILGDNSLLVTFDQA